METKTCDWCGKLRSKNFSADIHVPKVGSTTICNYCALELSGDYIINAFGKRNMLVESICIDKMLSHFRFDK